jgi:hypothetical protein
LEATPELRGKFLVKRGKRSMSRPANVGRAIHLMELTRATLLMYASCGWFFDDVAGIEASLVIRQAAHVLDLWKRFDGRPPTKDFLAQLAEARSNLPHAGTGADVFRRVAGHRTTSAEIAAALAFTELTGTSAPRAVAAVAGHTVATTSASPKNTAVHGRLKVTNQRTGETESVSYEARQRGPLELAAKVNETRVSLDDLPDELRDPLLRALLERLAAAPTLTAKECRHAIALGRSSEVADSHVDPMFHDVIAMLLGRLLAAEKADEAKEETLAVVLELIEALPEPQRFEPQRRVQEWIGMGFEALGARGKSPSLLVRALADKVGLRTTPERARSA